MTTDERHNLITNVADYITTKVFPYPHHNNVAAFSIDFQLSFNETEAKRIERGDGHKVIIEKLLEMAIPKV